MKKIGAITLAAGIALMSTWSSQARAELQTWDATIAISTNPIWLNGTLIPHQLDAVFTVDASQPLVNGAASPVVSVTIDGQSTQTLNTSLAMGPPYGQGMFFLELSDTRSDGLTDLIFSDPGVVSAGGALPATTVGQALAIFGADVAAVLPSDAPLGSPVPTLELALGWGQEYAIGNVVAFKQVGSGDTSTVAEPPILVLMSMGLLGMACRRWERP